MTNADIPKADGYATFREFDTALDAHVAEYYRGFQALELYWIQGGRKDYQGVECPNGHQGCSALAVGPGGNRTVGVIHGVVDVQKDKQTTDHVLAFSVTGRWTPAEGKEIPAGPGGHQPRPGWRWEGRRGVDEKGDPVVILIRCEDPADTPGGVGDPDVRSAAEGPNPRRWFGVGDLGVDPGLKGSESHIRQWDFGPASGCPDSPVVPDADERQEPVTVSGPAWTWEGRGGASGEPVGHERAADEADGHLELPYNLKRWAPVVTRCERTLHNLSVRGVNDHLQFCMEHSVTCPYPQWYCTCPNP